MHEYNKLGAQLAPKRLPQTFPSPGQVAVQGGAEVEVVGGMVVAVSLGVDGGEIVVRTVVVMVI